MILFRILTDEEARHVKRWQAPSLSNENGSVALTNDDIGSDLSDPGGAALLEMRRFVPAAELHDDANPHSEHAVASAGINQAATAAADLAPDALDVSGAVDVVQKNKQQASRQVSRVSLPNPSADMLQASYDEGYATGFAEGNAEVHQQDMNHLGELIGSLSRQSLVLDAALEQEVLELARAMARLILHREVEQDPELMRGIVREALRQLPPADKVPSVYLHPLDAGVVRALMSDDEAEMLVEDAGLPRGGCVLESGSTRMRAGLDDWLAAIASNVEKRSVADTQAVNDADDIAPPGSGVDNSTADS